MTPKPHKTSIVGILALLVLGGLVIWGVTALTSGMHGGASGTTPSTPMRADLREAVLRNDAAALRAAIANGADVNLPIPTDEGGRAGMTPLIHASFEGTPETVRALVEAKAKTESRTVDGRTALMYAAGWGDASKVRLLLDAGARTDARASDGWTALMFAAARGEVGSVRALTEAGADVQATNKWRQTALMAAARTGSLEKVNALLESGAQAGAADLNGDTALTIAAANDVPPTILEALVRAGAPVNAGDLDGVTALMKAAERGDLAQVRTLLALGADRAIKDKPNGWTARDWAAKRDDEQGRAVVALLDAR
jgi:ankyrin repeat protein